jgi:hypothetical protein
MEPRSGSRNKLGSSAEMKFSSASSTLRAWPVIRHCVGAAVRSRELGHGERLLIGIVHADRKGPTEPHRDLGQAVLLIVVHPVHHFHLHRVDRSAGFIRDWLVVFVITDHTHATAYTMPMLLIFFNFLEGVVAPGEFGRGSVVEL